ncbi:MAG: endonuclease/exonuclease/phosphatase family protein [Rivularia sp. (in: cyanobacteria)]
MWLIKFWTKILAGLAVVATILSLAGDKWWIFAMMEHARVQYWLILLIALFVNFLTSKKRIHIWNILCIITFIINFVFILPLFIPPHQNSTQDLSTPPETIRLIHATLDSKKTDVSKAIEYLNKQKTDILFLLEVTPQSIRKLRRGLTNYRLIAAQPKYTSHGIAWFVPRENTKPIELKRVGFISLPNDNNRPLLKATISYSGKEIILLCFHVISPRNAETVAYLKIEFDALANWSQRILQSNKQDLIVIGDFNSTPWYGQFRQLLSKSGLVNSQRGFGIQTTWHSILPPIFRIPIDTCLHSKSFITIRRFVGDDINSDHLPLFVEFKLS